MLKVIKSAGFSLAVFVFLATAPGKSQAAVSNWQQGVSVLPQNQTDFASQNFKQSIQNLAGTGADNVTLIIPYYQNSPSASDLQRGWNTPTDESLIAGVSYLHSLGMNVNFKIHAEMYDGQWRAQIDASDRNTWFANYGAILEHYGRLAQQNGVELYTIGAELIRMAADDHNSTNTENWRKLIAQVRAVYSGKITYSGNWGEGYEVDETARVKFWNDLDYLGIAAYYHLNRDWNDKSIASFKAGWSGWEASRILPFQQTWNRPVLFTEVGYKSYTGSHTQPWEWAGSGPYDGEEQANAYQALFEYWNDKGYMQGVSFWDWETNPNAGGQGNIGYTPQNKPAQQVMKNWFGSSTPPLVSDSGTPAFRDSTGSSSPSSPAVNQDVTLNAAIKNTGGAASGIIVDLEVYNSNSQKVFQKFFDNQTFAQNETKNFSAQFTPTNTGTYRYSLGVFNSAWNVNYAWKDISQFTVSPSSPTTPPDSTPVCGNTGNNAFFACYYDNADLTNLKITRTESAINFEWNQSSPDPSIGADTFSAQWLGNFNFDSASYNFSATADDGIRVFIDNQLVLDKWIDQPSTTYNFSRTLTSGTHQLKILYYENAGGAIAKLNWAKAGSATPPPPVTSAQVDVWWPTNGATISGIQPFQAIVPNKDINSYTMFWQVDGGTLNLMANDSSNGLAHKRAWVDVSGWQWRGTRPFGPYKINFVAKDSAGNIIAQKEITISTN